MLEASIRETEGLCLPVNLVSLEAPTDEKKAQDQETLVDKDGFKKLTALCVSRIEAAAADGRLAKTADMASVLYRWKEWGGDDGPMQFVNVLVQTLDGTLAFLRAFLHRATSHGLGEFVAKERWYIPLKIIEDFVQWETIEALTKDISVESLSSAEDRRAIEAFVRAVHRRRKGKPDYGVGINIGDDD